MSDFWKAIMEHVQTRMAYSTVRHPQSDGQTERVNQTLEIALCMYTAGHRDSWSKWLSVLAHAYNSTPHLSTGYSPHFLLMGYEPRGPVDHIGGISPAIGWPGSINRKAKTWLEELYKTQHSIATLFKVIPSEPSPEGKDFVTELQNVCQEARDMLAFAIVVQAKAYNWCRQVETF